MYFKTIILVCIGLLGLQCGTEQKIKPVSNDSTQTADIKANVAIQVALLPISFEGTEPIIHPIGVVDTSQKSGRGIFEKLGSISSDDYSHSNGFYLNNYQEDTYTCELTNLVFEHDSVFNTLSSEPVTIVWFEYQRKLADADMGEYILYEVSDPKPNGSAIKSLWISNVNGKNFTRITTETESYTDGQLFMPQARFYFQTQSDTNADGEINANDLFQQYYLQFAPSGYVKHAYNAIQYLKQVK